MARKRARKSTETCITLRTPTGLSVEIPCGVALQEMAMRWSYVTRNRRRWMSIDRRREEQRTRAHDELIELGVTEDQLEQLAHAELIEVAVPYTREDRDWEGRVLPWEYVLSSATRRYRGERRVTVIRHLERQRRARGHPQELSALLVASAPGSFADLYDFDSELRGIAASLELTTTEGDDRAPVLRDPTLERLADSIREGAPAVVHVSAVDAHQGASMLDEPQPTRDGVYLLGDGRRETLVSAHDLAKALAPTRRPPELVFFNTYNSASRLAPLAVAEGVGAAIGFQSEIDDSLAELFASTFFRAWRLSDRDALHAFDVAWEWLREQRGLHGSGVVLWSEKSLVAEGAPRRASIARKRDGVRAKMAEDVRRSIVVAPSADVGAREALERVLAAEIRPHPRMNYSVLHNNGDMFESFDLRLFETGRLRGIEVEVKLHVGSHVFPYRATFDRDSSMPPSIKSDVRVPLTWEFVRTLDESIRTSLYVRVAHEGTVLREETHTVTLDPVEEWLDNERNGVWLPSFVLPRDPAIGRVIEHAQRYLCALVDDVHAGFDGYQSVDPSADDPAELVDLQVRAIWSALLLDLQLAYINPPPAYSTSAQRLRKPSQVIDGRRGTCIDLAILLASCLEYVEIYPVVFLLKGHAFPGYWRSEESYERFVEAVAQEPTVTRESSRTDGSFRGPPWFVRSSAYDEILTLVNDDHLVPLETVGVTSGTSFEEAFAYGVENLADPDEFDALVDIVIARGHDVTPLPL
ncbi:MAG: CHAT domain-containing protein [Planctomycetes bacterium]|nr:CHAT domain-containing protein [Planctomycetota bacterium]